MSEQVSQLKDNEFLYSHLGEYQDDDLGAEDRKRFDSVLSTLDSGIPQKYVEARGMFQSAYQKYSLTEGQLHTLRTLVEDDVSRADHEAGNIKDLGATEMRGNTFRAVVLLSLVFGVFCLSYYFLAPPSRISFDALGTLVYEASAMSDDIDRLDLPTEEISEVQNYLQVVPKYFGSVAKLCNL